MRRAESVTTSIPEPSRLWPVDRLLLGALAALGAVTAVLPPPALPQAGRLLLVFGALALFLAATAWAGPSSRVADALHAFAPLLVIVGIFETVGFVVAAANPTRWDPVFGSLDARLLGPVVGAWRGAFGRPAWFTDLLSAFYVSYYLVPTAMAGALYAQRRRRDFDRFVFGLQVTLLASYLCYFLFPTSGPRVALEHGQAVLGGGALSAGVRGFLHLFELNKLDAFPSGHTAVSLVFLHYGWRMLPRWRAPLLVTVVAIVFSTVYLSHHYAVDLAGGALLAAAVLALMPRLERAFGVKPAGAWLATGEQAS